MPKKLRLSQADFSLLRKQKSHRIFGGYFSLLVYPLPLSLVGPRVAYVIPKKVVSKAVMRNKIERWCREATRLHQNTLNPDYAYIFSPKKDILGASYMDIERDIQALLSKV